MSARSARPSEPHRWLGMGVALLAVAIVSRLAELRAGPPPLETVLLSASGSAPPGVRLVAPCPPGTLPDDGVCIPAPHPADLAPPASSSELREREGKTGRAELYEHIPRRPDRPRDFRAYRLPVEPRAGQDLFSSGYDLDQPSHLQRRGARHARVGHGGLDLAAPRGTPVRLVALEQQVGDAELLFLGDFYGTSVITLHTVRDAEGLREVLAIFAHLDGTAPGLAVGLPLPDGTVLGFVGDSQSPGDVHLHYELRRLRVGVSPRSMPAPALVLTEHSVVVDPRNLLPLLTP